MKVNEKSSVAIVFVVEKAFEALLEKEDYVLVDGCCEVEGISSGSCLRIECGHGKTRKKEASRLFFKRHIEKPFEVMRGRDRDFTTFVLRDE